MVAERTDVLVDLREKPEPCKRLVIAVSGVRTTSPQNDFLPTSIHRQMKALITKLFAYELLKSTGCRFCNQRYEPTLAR